MGEVIDFTEHDGTLHFTVLAMCVACSHRWYGTVSQETNLLQLQCPECGDFDSFASFFPHDYVRCHG